MLGLFVVIAALLRTADTGVYFRLADQVAMVLLGLFIAGGVLLLARPRVRADAAGIEVRNVVRDPVAALGPGRSGSPSRTPRRGPGWTCPTTSTCR